MGITPLLIQLATDQIPQTISTGSYPWRRSKDEEARTTGIGGAGRGIQRDPECDVP